MRNTQSNVAVALLYQTQELGRHLRDTLATLGTPIVYEAATDHLDSVALENSGARVVVVNLDPAVEAHLDEVYGLLEDDRYSVVFNDAQVSSSLSGWDQARWARHLAAKILGEADIDPPRPEGAEAIPAPEADSAISRAHATDESDEFETLATSEPEFTADRPSLIEPQPPEPELDSVVAETASPLDMLESRYDEMNQSATASFPTPAPPPAEEFDFSTLEAVTAAPALPRDGTQATLADEFLDDVPQADRKPAPPFESADEDVFDLSMLDSLLEDSPSASPAKPDAIDVGDLGDLGSIESMHAPETAANDVDLGGIDVSGLTLIEEDAVDAPSAPVPKPETTIASMAGLAAAADWSLEDMLEGEAAAPPPPVPSAPSKPAQFGIEKMSAAEYLAPETTDAAAPPVPSSLDFSFELVPIEEAVAPQQVEQRAHETWLDPDQVKAPAKIKRVWVLGASIGGPEAVREFLGELPRDYPALFLLAQHMGAEFVDLMAQQLAKGTPLTVRTPTHGERVGHGEVLIVPTTHRLQVDPEGIVVLERSASEAPYSPSIDRVLRDAADRYGASASAIIFSGMTTDSVEGAKYLTGKGGSVYVQHPDTCVVSSMIDGVIEAGVAKFLGSPKELAEHLLADANKR